MNEITPLKNHVVMLILHCILPLQLCLKLREEFEILATLNSLMDEDSMVVFELALLISNIKKESCNILEFFFPCLRKYEEKIV
jgi:hypothetical protein